jgi:hypothetical protein
MTTDQKPLPFVYQFGAGKFLSMPYPDNSMLIEFKVLLLVCPK